jgi:chromosome partitioning protein
MRKICIINQKGGVAKTTTAINLAAGLARAGRRVLLVDLDAQGNIESSIGSTSQKTLYDYLIENAELKECISRMGTNLDLLRSNETLTKAEIMIAQLPTDNALVLKERFSTINGYDYVIIDCAPSLGILNQNAMLYAQEAIIPVTTDYLGIDGMNKIMAAINEVNEHFDHDLKVTRIVPTLHDARIKSSVKALHYLQNEHYQLLADPVRVNSKLKEAPQAKKSIFSHAPSSRGAHDYASLVQVVLSDESAAQTNGQPSAVTSPV